VNSSAPTPSSAPAASPVAARTGGTALVECLAAHQVPLWTCVPGESFLAVLDALWQAQRQSAAEGALGPRVITTRHEAAAANMAEAAGKLTGRAAVCLVTRGPGASHASIALHTAYQDGTPLILVVGQVSRNLLGRDAFQEMDYERVFGASAKLVVTISDADRIPELVAQAMHVAHSGRPGPVVLVVPEDVQYDLTTAPPQIAPSSAAPPLATADRAALLEKLGAARRPVLIVGGPGWSQSVGDDVTAFAERNAIAMAAAFRWQDAVDNASPSYAGYLGLGGSPDLRRHVADADLIVALGPRLDDPTTNGYRLDPAAMRTVLVSQAPGDLGRPPAPAPALAVHASLESVAAALRAAELPTSAGRLQWRATLRRGQERFREPNGEGLKLNTAAVIAHLREVLPPDAIVTNGAGNYAIWLQRFFEFRRFGTQLAPRNGAMGYGVPAGLAAAALHPDRPVVTMAGDGCFLMSGNELATAVQFGLNVTVIVVNNGMLGTIRMHQERTFPGHVIATELRNPDFTAYAESFGALGLLVERTEEFPAALARALGYQGPALIELRTDPEQLSPDLRLRLRAALGHPAHEAQSGQVPLHLQPGAVGVAREQTAQQPAARVEDDAVGHRPDRERQVVRPPDREAGHPGQHRVAGRVAEQVEDLGVHRRLAVPREPARQAGGLLDAVRQRLQVRRLHPLAGGAHDRALHQDQDLIGHAIPRPSRPRRKRCRKSRRKRCRTGLAAR
jgi:acetolactate synthase I/II/III large subunit